MLKLFYQYGSNHSAALREYRRLKHLRKGPKLRIDLRKIIMKFEETGDLLPRGGWKQVRNETVEEVTTAVAERVSILIYSSAINQLSREFEIRWSVVRKTLRCPKRCSVTNAWYTRDGVPCHSFNSKAVIPALQERQCLQTIILMQDGASPYIRH
ncbi:hypothetical protein TNCV_1596331 [Trichonephila clavipes]|nr:hypothetical protein TNCV_1596331 [Trichonephila clavipes]